MKRFVILFAFILLLSGCKIKRFEFGSSHLNNMVELEEIIQVMMDEGNYDEDLKVPFDQTFIFLSYINGKLLVETVQYNVITNFDGELYHFDNTSWRPWSIDICIRVIM